MIVQNGNVSKGEIMGQPIKSLIIGTVALLVGAICVGAVKGGRAIGEKIGSGSN